MAAHVLAEKWRHRVPPDPDFINDANAAKRVAAKVDRWELHDVLDAFESDVDCTTSTCHFTWAALLPAKTLTLAALVAAGKITMEEAKEIL